MAPFNLRYFFIAHLMLSVFGLQLPETGQISNNEYPSCTGIFENPMYQNDTKFMITRRVSFQTKYMPFSENCCIWCQNESVDCINGESEDNHQLCLKTTTYVGPVKECCKISDERSIQFIAEKTPKRKFAPPNSPIEYEWKWKTFFPSYIFPKTIHIPIGGNEKRGKHREKRYLEICSFPNEFETASLSCKIYPESVKCTQQCAFGYTLQRGITQNMVCLKKENVWRPVGFLECQPFVDCTVALTSGGSVKCTTMSLKNPPTCTVSCMRYEDKDAVPEKTYTCRIDGKWDPPLPFCARPGQGLLLTTAPQKKLHD